MSLNIIEDILWNMGLDGEFEPDEKNELLKEISNNFGLIGGLNNCDALERYYQDNRSKIEKFIFDWFSKKKKRKVLIEI
jgi:hypothetical protein